MLTERTSNEKSNRPWGWGAVVCGLLAVAVVASGVGLSTRSVAEEPKKDAPKQEKKEEKKEEKKPKERPFVDPFDGVGPNLDEIFKKLGEGDEQGMAEFQKEVQRTLEELRKAMGPRGRLPGVVPLPGVPGVPFGAPAVQGQGRLGVRVEAPSETLSEQLDLPKDQGLVVREVVADSAAAKAGLKEHDILLEVAGKPVSRDPSGLAKMIEGVKADEKFDAVVLRKGRRETIKGVTLPETKTTKKPVAKKPVDGLGGRGNAVSTALTRDGDEFTLQEKSGDVTLTLTGTVEGGKAKLGSVTVKEGDSSKDYDSLEKVPEAHRERVQQLLEMAGKGNVKVEVRN
jgi:serine protease Do